MRGSNHTSLCSGTWEDSTASEWYFKALKSIIWRQNLMTSINTVLHFLKNIFIFFLFMENIWKSRISYFSFVCISGCKCIHFQWKQNILNAHSCIVFHGFEENLEICIASHYLQQLCFSWDHMAFSHWLLFKIY